MLAVLLLDVEESQVALEHHSIIFLGYQQKPKTGPLGCKVMIFFVLNGHSHAFSTAISIEPTACSSRINLVGLTSTRVQCQSISKYLYSCLGSNFSNVKCNKQIKGLFRSPKKYQRQNRLFYLRRSLSPASERLTSGLEDCPGPSSICCNGGIVEDASRHHAHIPGWLICWVGPLMFWMEFCASLGFYGGLTPSCVEKLVDGGWKKVAFFS